MGEAVIGGLYKKTKSKVKVAVDLGNAVESGQSLVCQATERWVDVALLEDWGVPKCSALGFLRAWRRAHHEGVHDLCTLWGDIADSVQAKIPFADAYDLAMASWFADRGGVKSLKLIIIVMVF